MRFRRQRSVPAPDPGPLDEVLDAERTAAEAIAAARRDAGAWRTSEQQAIDTAREASLAELAAQAIRDENAARQAAGDAAAEIIAAAEAFAERLHSLTDRELHTVVAPHVDAIGGRPRP